MTAIDSARARPRTRLGLFRYSAWDAIPAALVYLQFALLIAFLIAWPQMGWPARVVCGALYAASIGWNLDSCAHNFVHNPFFAWEPLNRLTAYLFTVELGAPQTMYKYVHMRHHAGNSDRIGPDGTTKDPISLYQYGADDKAEPALSYIFLQFWRDDSALAGARKIAVKRPKEAAQVRHEFWAMLAVYGVLLAVNWRFVLFLAPFYYLGQCFSYLIAYYEHLGANPDDPIATGVSTYEPFYNWVFLNNGYHAEHHHRPKVHWTKMAAVRRETAQAQAAAGVRTLRLAHFLGFLDRSTWSVPTARARRVRAVSSRDAVA